MYASTTSSVDEYTSAASTPTFMDLGHSFWMDPMPLPQQQQGPDFNSSVGYYNMMPSQSPGTIYCGDQDRVTPLILTCPPPPLSEFLPVSLPEYHYHSSYCHLQLQPARSPVDDCHHRSFSSSPGIGNVATYIPSTVMMTTTMPTATVSSLGLDLPAVAAVAADIRPYTCRICPRMFARKHDLQRHTRVHTGDKPYACLSCKKAFARTDALKRHLRMEDRCRLSPEVQAMKYAGKRRYRNL